MAVNSPPPHSPPALARTTGLAVDRVRSATAVNAAEWDRLARPNTLYLSHTWVRGVEEALHMDTEYLLVSIGERLVGVAQAVRTRRAAAQ